MAMIQALSNASSGLAAAARAAEVASQNVANAATPGYGRRSLQLSAVVIGGAGAGVEVAGVHRASDSRLATDIRVARGGVAAGEARTDALARIEAAIGPASDPRSLAASVTDLEEAFRDAASDPGDPILLGAVVDRFDRLTDRLSEASDAVNEARTVAERGIANDVDRLNRALSEVADLNAQIARAEAAGRDRSALEDRRRQVIDAVSDIVPLRGLERAGGQIALVTGTGLTLLDGSQPAFLEFDAANVLDPSMQVGGALSAVTIGGRVVSGGPDGGGLSGGTLGAALSLRDTELPAIQERLDTFALDLSERFGPGAADGTVPPGGSFFLDEGAPIDPAPDPGLAGRLALDPAIRAEPWRLRDGLGSLSEAALPDGSLLIGHAEALLGHGGRALDALVADLSRALAARREGAEGRVAAEATRLSAFQTADRANAVDIDSEMRDLVLIEHMYEANAKVLQTIDEMLRRLAAI